MIRALIRHVRRVLRDTFPDIATNKAIRNSQRLAWYAEQERRRRIHRANESPRPVRR